MEADRLKVEQEVVGDEEQERGRKGRREKKRARKRKSRGY